MRNASQSAYAPLPRRTDFCSSTAVRWRYAPGWLACDECSAIIETEDKIGLFTKTLETFKEKVLGGKNWASMDTTERKEIATGIEYVHGHFWNEAVSGRQEVKA